MVFLQCLQCGNPFEVPQSRKNKAKYCSQKCFGLAHRTRVKKMCCTCGHAFFISKSRNDRKEGLYCSKKCYGIAKKRSVENTCVLCGKIFETIPSEKRPYCSYKCKARAMGKPPVERLCPVCGNSFTTYPTSQNNQYCSIECSYKGRDSRIEYICQQCGTKFKSRSKRRKFCSWICYMTSRPRMPRTEREKYLPSNWIELRQTVRQRDNYHCTRCGKIGNDSMPVHHIIPLILSRNNRTSNLRTLCKACHKTLDSQFLWLL